MGRLITFQEFCCMRNNPMGYAGLDRNGKISTKLLKTNVAGGVLQLSNEPQPKIDSSFINTDIPGGLVSLDENGRIRQESLPSTAVSSFKGQYATVNALRAAYPKANLADYAFVDGEGYYYWNPFIVINGVVTPSWVSQNISYAEYMLLDDNAKLAVHYIVIT